MSTKDIEEMEAIFKKFNWWTTEDIKGSPEAKYNDTWLSNSQVQVLYNLIKQKNETN